MKKTILVIFCIICFFNLSFGIELNTGLRYGLKQISDPIIRDTYSNSYYLTPYLSTNLNKWLIFELSYEFGNKAKGQLGSQNFDSTLQISGLNLSCIMHYQITFFDIFLKVSYGNYSYTQKIDNPALNVEVDHKKSSFSYGCGVNFLIHKNLFIITSIRRIPLNVQPYDIKVDLSSWAISVGVGFKFKLKF